jgi:hypothetical protein
MFKSVLVALKPSAAQQYVIDYGLTIAQQLGADLAAIDNDRRKSNRAA